MTPTATAFGALGFPALASSLFAAVDKVGDPALSTVLALGGILATVLSVRSLRDALHAVPPAVRVQEERQDA